MNLEELLPEKMKQKRWIAVFVTDEEFISNDGERFNGTYIWGSNNQTTLMREIEKHSWGTFYTGYLWKKDDLSTPRFLIDRKVNEAKNVRTNRLLLVPYEEVSSYAMHTPEDVEKFLTDVKKEGHTHISLLRGMEKDYGLFQGLEAKYFKKRKRIYAYWSGSPIEYNYVYMVYPSNENRTISLVDLREKNRTVKSVKEEDVQEVKDNGVLLLRSGERVTLFAVKPVRVKRKDLVKE